MSASLSVGWFEEGRPFARVNFAIAGALLLHLGFAFIPTEVKSAASKSVEPWALIDVEVPLAPAPEVPEPTTTDAAPDARPVEASARVSASAASPRSEAASGADSADSGAPDAAAAEEAAPLETADFGESAWALPSGSGTALGRGVSRAARGGGNGGESRVSLLSARDFSREASAPDLRPWVERNFPSIARMYKVEGTVTVSATIDPQGTPSDVRVESVAPGGRGFGEACARTVHQGPKWKPKLNRDGRPLSSRVTYTCAFELPAELKSAPAAAVSEGAGQRVWTHSSE